MATYIVEIRSIRNQKRRRCQEGEPKIKKDLTFQKELLNWSEVRPERLPLVICTPLKRSKKLLYLSK